MARRRRGGGKWAGSPPGWAGSPVPRRGEELGVVGALGLCDLISHPRCPQHPLSLSRAATSGGRVRTRGRAAERAPGRAARGSPGLAGAPASQTAGGGFGWDGEGVGPRSRLASLAGVAARRWGTAPGFSGGGSAPQPEITGYGAA